MSKTTIQQSIETSKPLYIALDIETTGFDPIKDQAIEVAAIRFDEEKIYDQFHTLLNPGIEIPETITHITGIRQSDVLDAPTLNQIQNDFEKGESDGNAAVLQLISAVAHRWQDTNYEK